MILQVNTSMIFVRFPHLRFPATRRGPPSYKVFITSANPMKNHGCFNGLKPLGINPLLNSKLRGPHLVPPHPPSTGTSNHATPSRSVFDWSELMDSSSAWAGREWFVVRKAEVRLSEVRAVFPEATKRGVGTGNGEGGPIYHPCWKWYVYLCELLILMVNVGKLQGWFGWFWLIWLILMVDVDKYTIHG